MFGERPCQKQTRRSSTYFPCFVDAPSPLGKMEVEMKKGVEKVSGLGHVLEVP